MQACLAPQLSSRTAGWYITQIGNKCQLKLRVLLHIRQLGEPHAEKRALGVEGSNVSLAHLRLVKTPLNMEMVISSQPVRLSVTAEGVKHTLTVHEAALKQIPYFKESSWCAGKTDLDITLPAGGWYWDRSTAIPAHPMLWTPIVQAIGHACMPDVLAVGVLPDA